MEGDMLGRRFGRTHARISIHSLRMEGDRLIRYPFSRIHAFQSTPSAWRETEKVEGVRKWQIHFNPLPPHGGRLLKLLREERGITISIHSLRMEGDRRKLRG